MKHIYGNRSNIYNSDNNIYLKPSKEDVEKLKKTLNLTSWQKKYLDNLKSWTEKYNYLKWIKNSC